MSFTAENLGSEQDAWITIVNVSLAIAQILATEEVHGWLRQANQSSEALQTGREMRILSEYTCNANGMDMFRPTQNY